MPGRVIGALKGEFFLQPLVFLPDQQFGEVLAFVVSVGFDAQRGQWIEPRRPDAACLLFQREIALPLFRRDTQTVACCCVVSGLRAEPVFWLVCT